MIIFVINVHSMYVTTYKWKYSKCLELYVNFTVYLRQVCTPRSSALPGHQTSDKRPLFNLINIQYIGITFAIHKQLHLNATFSLWSPISGSHRTILPVRGDWQFSINPCVSQEVAFNSMHSQRRLRSRRYIHICWIYYTFVWYIYGSFVLYSAMTIQRCGCVYDIQARGSRLSHLNFYLKISEKIRKYECAQLLPASI